MTGQKRYYLCNVWKICNIVGPKYYEFTKIVNLGINYKSVFAQFEWQCSQYLELNPTCGKVWDSYAY